MDFIPKTYWEERLVADFDLSGVGYKGLGLPFNTWMYRLRRHVFLSTLRQLSFDPSTATVLDIGSGTGFYVDCWHALGIKRLLGADITEVAVERLAKAYPGDQFLCLDIGDRDVLPAARHDFVSAMDVLFHIVDDARFEQALSNIADTLKPGGYLVWSDNFLQGQSVYGEHQVSRSLSTIESALQQAGLEVVSRKPAFVVMNAPVDTHIKWLVPMWSKIMRQVSRSSVVGQLVGASLYLSDRVLIRLLSESPTTEIMVCRKRG